ncbi:tripartite tricarboxylate transporter substrate-binding protein [Allopusillimonas ginsengisoli]|uniref:tripartite tricarboxylate transporter substrate-binding protein n=1 Tax=Allopusillimonas ginsengisoli TaxID=453575 RepID=UPI00101FA4B6|nr:tripartite tricarboxylate transporter substrate-binding protein [Allopusillimonas ginsengisoli]TEA77222.1 tripartite tricarboxylate transporter substrate binding protein [Allopusillimonas ginsengisoli]
MIKRNRTRLLIPLLALALGTSAISPTATAASSNAPMRIVIGFAPGGALDILARTLAEKLRISLGKTVIVENRPGASSRVALEHVVRAPADGNTVLISSSSPLIIFPLTYKRLSYDADADLQPIARIANVPAVASAGVQQPYRTMEEYLAWVKQNPSQGSVGLSALGGVLHFGLLTLSEAIDIPLVPIPYRGAAMMLTDEIGGTLPLGIDAVAGQVELYRSGKIRFLGVTGTERSTLLPEVPTFQEAGAPGFEAASGWYGAFVPKGVPAATVAKIEKALLDAAADPEVVEKIAPLGLEMSGKPGAELRQQILEERAKWKPIVEASGFTADS